MTFAVDPEVGAMLAAKTAGSGPMPPPPAVGDVKGRRVALEAMLEQADNNAQPVHSDLEITEQEVTNPDGTTLPARWYRLASGGTGTAAAAAG